MHDPAPWHTDSFQLCGPLSCYSECQDVYQACRGWTIAVYEHVLNNDFGIRLLGTAVLSTYETDGDLGKTVRAACSVETTEIGR